MDVESFSRWGTKQSELVSTTSCRDTGLSVDTGTVYMIGPHDLIDPLLRKFNGLKSLEHYNGHTFEIFEAWGGLPQLASRLVKN